MVIVKVMALAFAGECPECGYAYNRMAALTVDDMRNLTKADMFDCRTCNTRLPEWAERQLGDR